MSVSVMMRKEKSRDEVAAAACTKCLGLLSENGSFSWTMSETTPRALCSREKGREEGGKEGRKGVGTASQEASKAKGLATSGRKEGSAGRTSAQTSDYGHIPPSTTPRPPLCQAHGRARRARLGVHHTRAPWYYASYAFMDLCSLQWWLERLPRGMAPSGRSHAFLHLSD